MISTKTLIGWLAAFLCCPLGARAQSGQIVRPVLEVPRTTQAPRLLAEPDEAVWRGAAWIPALSLSIGPEARTAQAQPTQIRLLWDENFLYARFECRDTEINAPFPGGAAGRDAPHYQGDVAEIFLDPVGDARQTLELQVSPKNGVFDQLLLLTGEAKSGVDGVLNQEIISRESWEFPTWNLEGVRSATSAQTDGWIVDIALPAAPLLKRLGLKKWAPMTLRANFLRYDWPLRGDKGAMTALNWSPVMWGRPHRSPQAMGFLQLKP